MKSAMRHKATGKSKDPKAFKLALCALLLALCVSAKAQQPARIPRIGYLTGVHLTAIAARIEALRRGLRELGYIEGKTIVIEWRSSEERPDRLPALAAEFVRLKVDRHGCWAAHSCCKRCNANDPNRHGPR